jgi:hypothetical protein
LFGDTEEDFGLFKAAIDKIKTKSKIFFVGVGRKLRNSNGDVKLTIKSYYDINKKLEEKILSKGEFYGSSNYNSCNNVRQIQNSN